MTGEPKEMAGGTMDLQNLLVARIKAQAGVARTIPFIFPDQVKETTETLCGLREP